MEWKKWFIALIVGMAGAVIVNTVPQNVQCRMRTQMEETRPITGWWGTLYPKFCFAELPEDTDEQEDVKISFWLARVFDW